MAKYQADKLQRWSLIMSTFKYIIEVLPGLANVWADLLSRWGKTSPPATHHALRATPIHVLAINHVSPLTSPAFVWPSQAEIAAVQRLDAALLEGEEAAQVQWDDDAGYFLTVDKKIWLPQTENALDLRMRIAVIAHMGVGGHRRVKGTLQAVHDVFWWRHLKTEITAFVQSCIHCKQIDGKTEPRPWGTALHATQPNELIHWDWISLPKCASGNAYVLVIRDDMSGFVKLYPAGSADAETTAACLMDWFATFGVCHTWVSDQGSHFKNEVIEGLRHQLGAHHHFTTAYAPWSNGTVEVMNRLMVRLLRGLCCELNLKHNQWDSVLMLVMSALNHMPADRLKGVAPVKAFLALAATPPLTAFMHPRLHEPVEYQWIQHERLEHIRLVAESLEEMHRDCEDTSNARRAAARGQRARKREVKQTHFSLGDFVLVGSVLQHPHKLAVRWKGPCRVVNVVSDFVMDVEGLLPPHTVSRHHACRLKMYHEGGREVTDDLKDHIAHGDGGFLVEDIAECRHRDGVWEVLIKWFGLEDVENSWENAVCIYEDMPVAFKRLCRNKMRNKGNPHFKDMWDAVEHVLGHPL